MVQGRQTVWAMSNAARWWWLTPRLLFDRCKTCVAADRYDCDHTERAIRESQFKAILNEKDPPPGVLAVEAPPSFRGRIVSERVHELRSHPDFRIARRSLILSRLAQVIAERKVQGGLRRVLLTQAKRLEWLASRRYEALGGPASVPMEGDSDVES